LSGPADYFLSVNRQNYSIASNLPDRFTTVTLSQITLLHPVVWPGSGNITITNLAAKQFALHLITGMPVT
jgi:hypothetical protein